MKSKPHKLKSKTQTKSAFAGQLGISRQLLNAHLRRPDHPKLGDVPGWTAHLAAHGRDGSAPPDLKRKIAEARLAVLKQTERGLRQANDERDGRTIGKDEVSTGIKSCVALMFSELDRLFLNELPPALKGLDELAIKARCNGAIASLRASLRERFGKMGGNE